MKFSFKYLIVICPVFFLSFTSIGQVFESYTFQQLSKTSYSGYSDTLKKRKSCPKKFDNKKTQKQFEEYWYGRNTHIAEAIDNNNFVKDNLVLPYLLQIVQQIRDHNKTLIPYNITVLLDRTDVANATSFGEHILSLNAGIVLRSNSREELALYVAHELAHDILKHTENAMMERASIITSKDYEEAMKDILSSKYERYTKLVKIFEGFSFDRNRHSRYSEESADSLAITLLSNSNISFDASSFLNLDTMNNQYEWELKKRPAEHLKELNIEIDQQLFLKKVKGLSAANHNFKDTTIKEDSLKTHPDCALRYSKNIGRNSKENTKTPIPEDVKQAAFEIGLMDQYVNKRLTRCFYRLLQQKEKKDTINYYSAMSSAIFHYLLFTIKDMERFNAVQLRRKKDVSNDYFSLQNFMEQIPEKKLDEICIKLDNNNATATKEFQEFIDYFKLLYITAPESRESILKEFIEKYKASYPNSIYLELL